MATKKQAQQAVSKRGGMLFDECTAGHYEVTIEAPIGHSWGGDIHARRVHWHDCGNKPDFWQEVIAECAGLDEPVRCASDCEWWAL